MSKLTEVFIDAFSGCIGGLVNTLIFFPFDNVMIRLQDYKYESSNKGNISQKDNNWGDDNDRQQGMITKNQQDRQSATDEIPTKGSIVNQRKVWSKSFDSFIEIAQAEGILALYRGLLIGLIAAVMSSGGYFLFYRAWKNVFLIYYEALNPKLIMVITTLAGVKTGILTTPLWKIQTRMGIDKTNIGLLKHIKLIYNEGGIGEFWSGTLIGIILVLNPIINFVIYEQLKDGMSDIEGNNPSVTKIFLVSLVSKLISTVVTYPFQTLKTQAYTFKKDGNYAKATIGFVKSEGIFVLYRGLATKMTRTLLSNAVMMVSFEKTRFYLISLLASK